MEEKKRRKVKYAVLGTAATAVVLATGSLLAVAQTTGSQAAGLGQTLSGFRLSSIFGSNSQAAVNYYTSNLPFSMPKMSVPQFPHRIYNIVDYGAVSGDSGLNTTAINNAIDAAAAAGGGIVEIPAGTWVTGPIVLKSNVNLHLEAGALVQFTSDHSQYPLIPDGSKYTVQSPISATNAHNVAITGDGVFDGSGNTWAPVKQYKLSQKQWNDLIASGGVVSSDGTMWWPSAQGANAQTYMKTHSMTTKQDWENVKDYLRPNMVMFTGCENVLFDGPTFKNSPTHTVKIGDSTNVIIRNTKVSNFWYTQNTDGFDISADKNVLMYNDTINTGDDGIALESSSSYYVDPSHPAVQNIVIEDCHVYNAHSGFAIGSDTGGGVSNVYVHNDVYNGTVDGLRFKSSIGKGGLVHNIYVNGVQMQNIQDYAITFNDSYVDNGADMSSLSSNHSPSWVPQFQDIHIQNVNCDYALHALRMNGTPYSPIQNIDFTNVNIRANQGVTSQYTNNITEKNVTITTGVKELGLVLHQ